MGRRNYQTETDHVLAEWERSGMVPRLLLHACCAPCSSYVLEYLSAWAEITVFFYNPNITREEEYRKRVAEEKRLIAEMPVRHPVGFLEGSYEPERFFAETAGLEDLPEGGRRCEICFRMRLEETARVAAEGGFDWFTTSLTISPLKNAALLNTIGEVAGERRGVLFLPSDFKKRDGYRRSVALSAEYGLYRQDYCGCIYSERERMAVRKRREG